MKTIRLRLLMLMSVIGVGFPVASQAYDFSFNGLYYNIISEDERTVSVTHGSPLNEGYVEGHLSIPPKVMHNSKSYSVTEIGDYAFYNCSGLTSVDIPNSVTTIGYVAFNHCSGLTNVDIPNSVTTIGDNAFCYCSGLTSVDIPNSVTTIGDNAFYNSKPEKIYCHWKKPIKLGDLGFSDKCLMNSTLYVPIGTKIEYEKVDPWRNFRNIEEIDYESISRINDIIDSNRLTAKETGRFDTNGNRVNEDFKGVIIVRFSDGSTKKYINR